MAGLTRKYLQDHMSADRSSVEVTGEVETTGDLGEWLEEAILAAAHDHLTSEEDREEIQVTITVTLRPQGTDAGEAGAEGGCIEHCWEVSLPGGLASFTRCKHTGYKGNQPGPG